jgi:Tol biopolymer transport system component
VLKSLGWRFNEDGFSLSPDGRYVAYAAYPVNPPTARPAATEAPDTYIYVVPANDGSREIVVANTSGRNRKPLWTPDGSHIVFTSDRESSVGLWASAVKDGKPFGSATLIKDKIGDIRPIGVTRSGTYYYGVGRHDYKLTTVPFAPRQSDALSADLTAIPGVVYATWSPDGKSLAFVKWGSRGYDLALHPLDTAQERTVVPADGNGWYGGPIWLHDGKSLVVARVGTPVIWGRLDLQSGRFAQIFALEKNEATGGGAASPDDRTLYIPRRRVQAGSWTESIVARDLTTDAERRIMTISGVADRAAETPDAHDLNIGRVLLSPDGRQLVYTRVVANERNWHLGIVGVDGRDARELYAPPVNSWVDLVGWTPDAQWILFEQDSMIMRVPAAGGAAEPTGIAVPGERQQSKPTPSLFLSPDGTRLAIRYSGWVGETWAIDNIGALVSRNQQ